jgi:hypothetical protein
MDSPVAGKVQASFPQQTWTQAPTGHFERFDAKILDQMGALVKTEPRPVSQQAGSFQSRRHRPSRCHEINDHLS